MTPEEATALIGPGIQHDLPAQRWLDLGAGRGTFTRALLHLLPPGSSVCAVDTDKAALQQIGPGAEGLLLETRVMDFRNTAQLPVGNHGILMANALHFVEDKQEFLERLTPHLVPGGVLLLVEYELNRSSTWVPYPLSFDKMQVLVRRCGFGAVRKIGTRQSDYVSGGMYAAVAVVNPTSSNRE